jgi:hypothetical protein
MNESKNPLAQLLQEKQFIGWTCRMDFENATVLTSDELKLTANGVPLHSFLLATPLSAKSSDAVGEVVLLRVIGSAPLPQDGELLARKSEALRNRELKISAGVEPQSEFQFGGLLCRILGTFYLRDGQLRLGSDVENYSCALDLNVYRPTGEALSRIVNYISPERAAAAQAEATRLGLRAALPAFPIGTVRYASTDRLHRGDEKDKAVFNFNAIDFLARRTRFSA